MNNINFVFFLINLFDIVLIIFFMAIVPLITRKNLLFGVRIPEAAGGSPEAKKLKHRYIVQILIMGIVLMLLCLLQFYLVPRYSLLICILAPLIMIPMQMVIYVPHWKAAKKLKQDNGWRTASAAVVETRSAAERMRFDALPWGWYIASIILILGSIIWSLAIYKNLPEQIVTHRDVTGNPDAWGAKGPMTVFMLPLIGLLTVGIMVLSNISIFRMKLQINQDNPELSFAQHQLYRKMMSHMLGIITLCCGVMFAFIQLVTIEVLPSSSSLILAVIIGLCVAILVPAIYIPLKAGQSGCRLKPYVDARHPLAAKSSVRIVHPGQGDDRYWKLGMFYYNPDDPAVLVEDRFGGNGGFNYARPAAIAFAAGMIILLVATVVVVAVFSFKM